MKVSLFGGNTDTVVLARHHHLQDWRRDGSGLHTHTMQATNARHVFPQLEATTGCCIGIHVLSHVFTMKSPCVAAAHHLLHVRAPWD